MLLIGMLCKYLITVKRLGFTKQITLYYLVYNKKPSQSLQLNVIYHELSENGSNLNVTRIHFMEVILS